MNHRHVDKQPQLTLSEKTMLLRGRNFWETQDIPRLDIPAILMTDGPHGLRKQSGDSDHVGLQDSVPATCFPTASLLASTWDEALIESMGVALGQACRTEGISILLGPGANLKRHPLCGRNFEYFSEDPLLSGTMATAWIKGVQSQGVGASLKHFVANNQETKRMVVDALIDERTLRELYLKSFELAVRQAQPWTVMSAYNKLNGVYLSEHRRLLDDILRREWGFEGVVVTDWGANNDRIAGLIAGQDLDMPGSGAYHSNMVEAAIKSGHLEEDILDRSVARLLTLIDKAERTKALTPPAYDPNDHHHLARRIAGEGSVLLKNEGKVLPLDPHKTTALIGGFATSPRYQGAGSSRIHPVRLVTPMDAFREMLGDRLMTAKGYDPSSDAIEEDWIAEAVACAKQAEQVVVIVGLPDTYESEGFDREHLHLPPSHNRLVEAIAAVHDEVVVVLQNGAPVVLPWLEDVAAILEVYLGGEAGGEAMADVLFGFTRPSGRLAETFPKHLSDVPADQHFPGTDNQVSYREGLYVGYRAFDTLDIEPLFPFGYGLSYATFSYADINVVLLEDHLQVTLSITNHDDVNDKDVIQVYVGHPDSVVVRPAQELKGYTKVEVPAQATKQVQIDIPLERLSIFQDGTWKVERGTYQIRIGRSSRDILAEHSIDIASTDEVLADAPSVYLHPDASFAPTLEEFQTLLGRDVPHPSSIRPFTVNSTMEDVQASFAGRILHRLVARQLSSVVGDNLDAVSRRMIERSLAEMPLRNLAIMSGGALSMGRLLGLIDWMNRKPIRGLWKVIRG